MDRNGPSDVELLEMAREVLAMCTDHSLKDIITDLTITKSSELTINRIFDNKFLTELAPQTPAPKTHIPESEVVLLLSSDDDSDDDKSSRSIPKASSRTISKEATSRTLTFGDMDIDSYSYKYGLSNASPSEERVISSRPRNKTTKATEESELVVISIHSQSTKARKTTGEFKQVTRMSSDALSDWDFEPTPRPIQRSVSSSTFSSKDSKKFSLSRSIDESAVSDLSVSTTMPNGSSSSFKSPGLLPSTMPSKRTSVSGSTAAKLTRNLLDSPPTLNELRSKTALEINDVDWELEGGTEKCKSSTEVDTRTGTDVLDEGTQWDSLLDAGLSPPTIPMIEPDDSDLDDIISDMSWKTSRSKKEKATNIRKEKRRATVLPEDLQGWDGESGQGGNLLAGDHYQGEYLSLEEEIVGRAKRKQKRAKSDVDIEDGTSENGTPTSKAELQKAEKEALKQAKEKAKLIKEAEKQAKKAAREEELAKKKALREQELARKRELKEKDRQNKEEEKTAEIMAAREARINNRLTGKSSAAKEMILCIDESLYRSSFGETLRDYLSAIDCQVDLQSCDSNFTTDSIPIRNLIFWRRSINSQYDDDQDIFLPIDDDEKHTELELFSVIYFEAKDFANTTQLGQLKSTLTTVRRDMSIKKNKERLKLSGLSGYQSASLKDIREQKHRIIFLISGMETFLRGLRKVTTDRFRQAVLASLQNGDDENTPLPSLRATAEESAVDYDRIEKELLWLQLEEDCFIIQTSDDDETAQALVTLTEQIGIRPYK
ncbi:hypothetical protein BGZ46_001315 [Entomortierella lignicola]|nr:hypothetical protein BGZ46_001315 [Entomortierella lignicola]